MPPQIYCSIKFVTMVIPSKRVSLASCSSVRLSGTGHLAEYLHHRTTTPQPPRRPEVQLRSPPKPHLLLTTSSSTAAAPPHHHLLPNPMSSSPPWLLLPKRIKNYPIARKNTVGHRGLLRSIDSVAWM